MKPLGSFTFVLHSHLPYVIAHGKWPHGMDWLNEAAAETYIPLLNIFRKLVHEGVKPRVTLGITPVLAEQLADKTFKEEFKGYLRAKIEAAEADERQFETYGHRNLASVAKMWQDHFGEILRNFRERYGEDIVGGFRELQDAGAIEIITSAATHGYLPLLGEDASVEAQIRAGVATYKKHFGRAPRGIWLPECAYRPRYRWAPPIEGFGEARERKGVEEVLHENGIRYFIVDSHLLEGGKAVGVYLDRFEALKQLWGRFEEEFVTKIDREAKSPYGVYLVSSTGGGKPVAIFTRDPKSGLQVWSGEYGYPGDGNYLDFHKKHWPGGHRYWKVTSAQADLGEKMEYHPPDVEARLRENAEHFVSLVRGILEENREKTGEGGVVTAPFDTELFGHWWFEGPRWLYHVIKGMDAAEEIDLTTAGDYLEAHPPREVITIPEGSWGEGGFHWIWFNDWNKWTWKYIYDAEGKMKAMAEKYARTENADLERVLKQLARALLLLESSDWQFLISTWAARDYAELRCSNHYNDFLRLHAMAEKIARGEQPHVGDWEFLGDCERRDCLFQHIDPAWWLQNPSE